MKRLAFVLLSLIFACVTLPPSRSDTYSIVMAPLRRFESETPINCESNDLWYSWELSKAFVKLDNSLDHARFTASMNFEIADSALKNGCLDFADKAYREIIVIYIGTAYAAYRDRARIGIDDIRAARAK